VPVRTACHYFENHKGKVIGIVLCGFGVSASFMNIIAEEIINPHRYNPDSDGYYPKQIAENVILFY